MNSNHYENNGEHSGLPNQEQTQKVAKTTQIWIVWIESAAVLASLMKGKRDKYMEKYEY